MVNKAPVCCCDRSSTCAWPRRYASILPASVNQLANLHQQLRTHCIASLSNKRTSRFCVKEHPLLAVAALCKADGKQCFVKHCVRRQLTPGNSVSKSKCWGRATSSDHRYASSNRTPVSACTDSAAAYAYRRHPVLRKRRWQHWRAGHYAVTARLRTISAQRLSSSSQRKLLHKKLLEAVKSRLQMQSRML